MKHFFPFLIATLILCLFLYFSPCIPVFAQQHNSFASAKSLSLEQSVSIILPANASEYYYFASTNSSDTRYQVTLSEAASLSMSVYDDQGSALHFIDTTSNSSGWTGCINAISGNTRFFLMLHNQTKHNLSVLLSIKEVTSHSTANSKNSSKTKETATTKPSKKTKRTSPSKAKPTKKPSGKPKKTRKPKITATPVFSEKTRQRSSGSKITATKIPSPKKQSTSVSNNSVIKKPSQNYSTKSKNKTPINNTASQSPEPTASESQIDYTTNHSRSNSILANHFFRMTTGYSISALELLSLDSYDEEIELELLTPETIMLQNNIIYAKAPGLAVIKIIQNHNTTSCTIYIQNPS